MSETERLNADCHAATLDRAALQRAMQREGEAWRSLVTERCPHLFAYAPVFIVAAQMQQMRAVIKAVERVVALPGWSNSVIPAQAGIQSVENLSAQRGRAENSFSIKPLDSGLRRNDGWNEVQHFTKGVFYGYDFHLNADGAHLIEINSNAGGGFLNALLLDSQRETSWPGTATAEANFEQVFIEMFRNEWRLARGDAPLQGVAIVDEQPEAQYLYPEFMLAQRMFERAGIAAYIVEPAALHARGDGLYLESSGGDQKIDLVYNRLTDFSLQQHPVLRQAYLEGSAVLTPGPAHYARYADKRNLARLTDAEALCALGANEADIATLRAGIPRTIVVKAEMEEALWQERKSLFFKPSSGYGSKGAYRGANLTRRVFGDIMQGGYIAQRMAAPGERSVCVNEGEPVSLKYDVRCYVYEGGVQLVAARLYQGQTTNFRTPGGGFAPVYLVG
ncbi:MAG: hypothetical protein PHG89_05035 [Gallionella sp.]|nr:hypothetical protein [Gallionella sp.]